MARFGVSVHGFWTPAIHAGATTCVDAYTTPEEAIARVVVRVRQGGHDVPSDTIRRRFVTGTRNFKELYRQRVSYWQWFDNSGDMPLLREEGSNS